MRRLRTLTLLLLAGASLGACTLVPTDGTPQPVPSHEVPFSLLSPYPPKQSVTKNQTVIRSIWLINGNEMLASRSRRVSATNPVAQSLAALFAGPTDHEVTLGFSSDVPANYQVIGVGANNGMIFVRLSAPGTPLTNVAGALEAGQLVLTTAGASNVYVEVLVNNTPLRLTLPDGSQALQVRPSDYESLVSR